MDKQSQQKITLTIGAKALDRPHMNSWRTDLEKLARTNWHDLVVLKSVMGELDHRDSNKAIRLRETIEERIEELTIDQPFRWPTTDGEPGNNPISPFDAPEIGMLKLLGYTVGRNGLSRSGRRKILDDIYRMRLPIRVSNEYMDEGSVPNGGRRLQKIAESIAAFTRNAKRDRRQDKLLAIEHWEADLAYMKKSFYDGSRWSFEWPTT